MMRHSFFLRCSAITACLMLMGLLARKNSFGQRPNIILIVADDMRFDALSCNGAPPAVQTNAIDILAAQGVNFKKYYTVYSLCSPARASMITGMYPHIHNQISNEGGIFDTLLPRFPQLLHDAGYYTGLVGKYGLTSQQQSEFDYWLGFEGKIDYLNPAFNYNGTLQNIIGNTTTIITDSSAAFVAAADTPFLLITAHIAPHLHPVPPNEFANSIQVSDMQVPENYFPYSTYYPSFLYEESKTITDSLQLKELMTEYYKCVLAIDEGVSSIVSELLLRGIFNNTMIIFTSDNGFLFGDHTLIGKGFPYEPAPHLPLIIRYPGWFAPQSIVDDDIALNIDLFATIVEAAEITVSVPQSQGISLKKLYEGQMNRNYFMQEKIEYESADTSEIDNRPSFRTVEGLKYKYISYSCDEATEEFFNLQNDPLEKKNLVRNAAYEGLIQQYRSKLQQFQLEFNDTAAGDFEEMDCHLIVRPFNGNHNNQWQTLDSLKLAEGTIYYHPVNLEDADELFIYSSNGSEVMHLHRIADFAILQETLTTLSSGLYLLRFRVGKDWRTVKIINH